MMKKELYTTVLVQQIMDIIVQNLLRQEREAPENLDNERAQCSLSPYTKLTCTASKAAIILIFRNMLPGRLENGGTHGKEAC